MGVMASGGFLSAKQLAIYDRKLLKRAVDNQVFDRFGQVRTIKAGSNTKKAFAYRYKNILPATTILAEYDGTNIKNPNKIVREEVEYEVGHYGDHIIYSDELDLYDLDNITSSFLNVLGDQADLTVEIIRRDALSAGTNVLYADGAVDRAAVAVGAKKLTIADFDLMEIKLLNQGGKKFKEVITGTSAVGTTPVGSAYIGIIHPSVVIDLRKLDGFQRVENYSGFEKALKDEVGKIGEFRIIASNNAAYVDVGGTNVYLSLFMAMDSYATISLRGEGGIKTIVKPIGSSGVQDPLDQYGSIGWKAITGCAILNEAWLIRAETTASIEDGSSKHYFDYTV